MIMFKYEIFVSSWVKCWSRDSVKCIHSQPSLVKEIEPIGFALDAMVTVLKFMICEADFHHVSIALFIITFKLKFC